MASKPVKKKKGRASSTGTKFDKILSEMVDFDEVELFLSILGYGKNARGKTHFAGTMPGPIAYLDFNERGTLTLRGKGVKGWYVEEWEKVEEVYWYLHSGRHQFKSVIWDTATQAADIALNHVMGISSAMDTEASEVLITQRDWGNMSKQMKYWITKFRNLPNLHKLFLFQEKSLDEDTVEEGDSLVVPMISPSVRASACAAVDIIARFELFDKKVTTGKGDKKKVEKVPTYRIRIGPDTRYQTKFRTPDGVKLPVKFIEDPSFDKVMELYQTINQ